MNTQRIEEIKGNLNAMRHGWLSFDREWALALKAELRSLQKRS